MAQTTIDDREVKKIKAEIAQESEAKAVQQLSGDAEGPAVPQKRSVACD